MDPISIGLGVVGLGMSIFGSVSGAGVAKQEAQVSSNEATQEQSINNAKQQQMQLQAQRSQLENFRNVQRARAQGLNSATNQGAQFGSGLAGGQAEATDQGAYNSLGINQSLQTGNQIAGFNQNITNDKIQMAQLGGQAATDAGIASLGGAVMKAGPIIGAFGKNAAAGFSNAGNSFFGGGSVSGYGTGR
jgi:hypothetical protein